jgi:hypothetical protein
MSLFDDASLAMIPSAYKDGKLYSIKPTDGSGDFTFTRGSNLAATRVDVNGLIEKGRENLLLQSNQFDTTWTLSTASVTSGQSGYDGSNDAWLLTKTASSGNIYQGKSYSGVNTFSIYAKGNTTDWIRLRNTGGYVYFDVSNGVVGGNISAISPKIISVGNGWYRCEVAWNGTGTITQVFVADSDGSTSGSSGSIYIQDAQLELGLVATDYIETTTTTAQAGILEDMPRLDYSGGASCPSLLLEPQRTNLLTQSEYYGGGDWSRTRCGFVTNTSETLSPEGIYNASKMTSTDASESYAQNNVTLGSTSGTFTFFAKKGDLDYCHALVWDISANGRRQWFNLATGAVGTTTNFGSGYTKVDATIKDCGNGWYRCSFSWSGGNTTSGVRINISSGDGVIDSPINSYGYFYGAQCEASVSYPTSYIPTYGTSQTRSSDSCANLSLTTSTDFTIFFEAKDFCLINGNTGGSYDQVQFVFSPSGGAYNSGGSYHIYNNTLYYYDGSTNTDFGVIYNNQTDSKFALVKRGNQGIIYANGVKKTELTLPSGADAKVINWDAINITPSLTDAQGDVFGPNYKQLLKFDTALSDSELAALTTI